MEREIKLFGKPNIFENGQYLPVSLTPKAIALMAYLIVDGRPQPVKVLEDLLWNSDSSVQSGNLVEPLLGQIQQVLPQIERTAEQVVYRPSPETTVDFLTLQKQLNENDTDQLVKALPLFQADLLEGFLLADAPRFNEWLAISRERFRIRVIQAYHDLCRICEKNEHWAKGIILARYWSSLDPVDESAHQWLIYFLAKNGHTRAALQQFDYFRERLWSIMADQPYPATIKLVEDINSTLF